MSRFRERRASPARSWEPVHASKLLAREPGDLGDALPPCGRPVGKGASRTPHAHVPEESDWAVVPAKGPNKGGSPPAEDLEGRAWAEENVVGRATDRTQRRGSRDPGAGRPAERRLLWGLRCRHHPRQEPYELNAHVRICAGLCQEDAQASCCTRDEGGPFGAGLQEQASNSRKLLQSKAAVVNVTVKRRDLITSCVG